MLKDELDNLRLSAEEREEITRELESARRLIEQESKTPTSETQTGMREAIGKIVTVLKKSGYGISELTGFIHKIEKLSSYLGSEWIRNLFS